MTRLVLAPCSPFSVTADEMRDTARFAREHGLRLHTHLAETLDEQAFCLEHFGRRPVGHVESLGWLGDDAWFAHSVHLSEDEIRRMGAAGAGVSHCPSSNMRLGSGIAPIRELLQAGAAVSLGVDGSASNDSGNMLLEARNALLLSRLRPPACWLTAREVLAMATRGGARVLGRDDIGSLEVGKRADIALFSTAGIEYSGAGSDPLAALVFCVRQSPVDTLVIDGEVRIDQGRSAVDEPELAALHNRLAAGLLERAAAHTGIDFTLRQSREA
jgi:8-oxoguanine deaminase